MVIISIKRKVPTFEVGKSYQEVKRGNTFWVKDEMGGWIEVNKLKECEVKHEIS